MGRMILGRQPHVWISMRTGLILVLIANLSSAPCRAGLDDRTGFGYCAPPVPPPCIDTDETYAGPDTIRSCKEKVQRYVQTVAAYRVCLTRETQRAVLQVNERLDRYRCRSQAGASCPPR